jgi:hypothetical protein
MWCVNKVLHFPGCALPVEASSHLDLMHMANFQRLDVRAQAAGMRAARCGSLDWRGPLSMLVQNAFDRIAVRRTQTGFLWEDHWASVAMASRLAGLCGYVSNAETPDRFVTVLKDTSSLFQQYLVRHFGKDYLAAIGHGKKIGWQAVAAAFFRTAAAGLSCGFHLDGAIVALLWCDRTAGGVH